MTNSTTNAASNQQLEPSVQPCEWCKQIPETSRRPNQPVESVHCVNRFCPVRHAGWMAIGVWNGSRVSDGGVVARDLQRRLYDECVTANWDPERRNTFAEEIAHLHEELSEAFRAFRRHKDFEVREVNGKLEGIPIEFADVLIGMFYNAEIYGFDLLAAVERKHQFNLGRNYVAEGRQLHAPATASPAAPKEGEAES